jgi:hypothetical protein
MGRYSTQYTRIEKPRVDDMAGIGMVNKARHIIGCRLTKWVKNA